MHKKIRKNNNPILVALAIIYITSMAVFILYHIYFAKRIIPGVYVSDLYIGGLTVSDAVKLMSDKNPSEDQTVSIKFGNTGDDKPIFVKSSEIDFKFLYVKTAKEAFNIGRSGNLFKDLSSKVALFYKKIDIKYSYDYSSFKLRNYIDALYASKFEPAFEPKYGLDNKQNLIIISGKTGKKVDDDLASLIISGMSYNGSVLIDIFAKRSDPFFSDSDLAFLKPAVSEMLDLDYEFYFDLYSKKLSRLEILSLLKPIKNTNGLSIDVDEIYLSELIHLVALDIDRSPRVQILNVKEGRAIEFVAPQNGQKLKIDESKEVIRLSILSKNHKIQLAVEVTAPLENENSFGVKEIIGIGNSKFKGSISGRVKNIELAASRVSGVLVAPGEVFSFNEAIGEISRETGYSTAYVISKGRTVLGDGGGVCQVSTTLFRAAIAAGLPIIERNAHSYRVNYYEQDSPPGIDATIYSPSVDLKFKNDTLEYILISSEFNEKDSSLSFKIYGTKDGRIVDMTEPVVLSRTPPPASIYEADSSLPSGVKKQIEHSVWGASVKFDRTVKSKDGEILYQNTFKSNYRAWGAVYKVGI